METKLEIKLAKVNIFGLKALAISMDLCDWHCDKIFTGKIPTKKQVKEKWEEFRLLLDEAQEAKIDQEILVYRYAQQIVAQFKSFATIESFIS